MISDYHNLILKLRIGVLSALRRSLESRVWTLIISRIGGSNQTGI